MTLRQKGPLLTVVITIILAACSGEDKFTVRGSITGAADSTLYFERMTINGPAVVIDSVRLDSLGAFSFDDDSPPAPEYFRLRLGGQIIYLSADSAQEITVKADYPSMASGYTVEGGADCQKIKELTGKLMVLQGAVIGVERDTTLSHQGVVDSIGRMISRYKEEVKRDYIFREPNSGYAYFALFQTIAGVPIFNPAASDDDVKVFAAVATSWDTFHPGTLRGENLHNIAIEGMKNKRILEARRETLDTTRVTETGVIDIRLADNHGVFRSLSELKGKVAMLDFHLFANSESPERILTMREIYNKYHDKGFEIYQVSIDSDEHFWKEQTAALPWISVRDPSGVGSATLRLYNVRSLPDFFLIDRNNALVKRASQMDDVEEEIRELL